MLVFFFIFPNLYVLFCFVHKNHNMSTKQCSCVEHLKELVDGIIHNFRDFLFLTILAAMKESHVLDSLPIELTHVTHQLVSSVSCNCCFFNISINVDIIKQHLVKDFDFNVFVLQIVVADDHSQSTS